MTEEPAKVDEATATPSEPVPTASVEAQPVESASSGPTTETASAGTASTGTASTGTAPETVPEESVSAEPAAVAAAVAEADSDDEEDSEEQVELTPEEAAAAAVAAEQAARAAAELEAAEEALDLSEPEITPAGPIEEAVDDDEEIKFDWYILKVQSNRERSIAAALQRKVAIEGLDRLFGEILVPTEKVTEFKGGKKKIVERKLWPGYIAVQMHVNDDTWFAIRETGGIGDFTGASGAPTPMAPQDVAKILHKEEEETDDAPKLNIPYKPGDKIKVNDGNFESFEGEVSEIDDQSGKVTIMISIFGRSTPVELDYWQVESL